MIFYYIVSAPDVLVSPLRLTVIIMWHCLRSMFTDGVYSVYLAMKIIILVISLR